MIGPFVDAEWVTRAGDGIVLADVRFYLDGRSGRSEYERGHLPGAVYVDLDEVLSDPERAPAGGRHPLPDPERFAAGLGAIGIGDRDTVIGYDDAGGVIAARLVWMLRAIGQEAAVLDGGLAAWGGALETGPGHGRAPAPRTPRGWPPDRVASIGEIADPAARGDAVLIDARDPARFAGGADPVDPRSGHIPGAVNVPARGHLGTDGRLESEEALRSHFGAAGIGPASEVISYCGSGVTACFNLLAMERVGLGPGRLYPGSWSEWSRDPQRPVETG